MADAGCSGSRPFKGLLSHHGQDRSLQPSITTRPSVGSNTFRSTVASEPGREQYASFMGEGGRLSAPMPTHASPAIVGPTTRSAHLPYPGNMATAVIPPQSSFPIAHPTQYSQYNDHARQQEWTHEYLRSSTSTSNLNQSNEIGHKPVSMHGNINRSMLSPSPGLAHGMYSSPQFSSLGSHFPVMQQPYRGAEHGGDMNKWMDTHRPSGVAIEDVDQVLAQISGELEELAVETGPETGATGQREHMNRSHTEPQFVTPDLSNDAEGAGTNQQSAVSDLARKILQAVDHEDDEKWRESSFLALMRDFRDGRKDVAENSIQEVAATQ